MMSAAKNVLQEQKLYYIQSVCQLQLLQTYSLFFSLEL